MKRLLSLPFLCVLSLPAIGKAQALQEREPNNTPALATPVQLGKSLDARMSMPGDVDYFALELEAGTTVVIDWTGLRDIIDWNWVVSLHDTTGTTLVRSHGVTWVFTDSTIDSTAHRALWFTTPQTGRYVVHFFAEPTWTGASPDRIAGEHSYRLHVETVRARLESESNNAASSATPMTLGDTVSGALLPYGDVDFFALDLNAGTNLRLDLAVSALGCNALPLLTLLSPNGTQLVQETSSPVGGTFNPWIEYPIASSGRYLVSVSSWGSTPAWAGLPCYFLRSGTFTVPPPGPGEPTRIVAAGVGYYSSMVSSRNGDVFLSTGICETPNRRASSTIVRLEASGATTVVAESLIATGSPVVDGFGNLLQPALRPGMVAPLGVIWRIAPSGARTVFADSLRHPCAIALGPDGDVWVAENYGPTLRFDPLGHLKDSVQRPAYLNDGRMAFSPDGFLYTTTHGGYLYRFENGQWTRQWFPSQAGMADIFAFDRDGYAYTAQRGYFGNSLRNKIMLVDPSGRAVSNPLAWLNDPIAFAFVEKRLLVLRSNRNAEPYDIVELNPAAVRSHGYFPDVRFAGIALDSLRPAAVGMPWADTLRAANSNAKGPWTIINGAIPKGLTLNQATGVLAGTPAEAGTFAVTVRAAFGDSAGIGRTALSVSAPQVSEIEIVNALLGLDALPVALAEFLDQLGNKNGRLDVGDLRAYVRAQGRLN